MNIQKLRTEEIVVKKKEADSKLGYKLEACAHVIHVELYYGTNHCFFHVG